MKEIICFTTSLANGGAERQLSILANLLVEKGYSVKFVTFSGNKDEYSLNPKINRVRIFQNGGVFKRIFEIFNYFTKTDCDCIISFGARCNFLALSSLLFRRNVRIIAGERCATFNGLSWYKKLNYKFLYKRADFIVPNNFTQKKEIESLYPSLIKKTHVITNYTDLNQFVVHPMPQNDKVRIGVFGRYGKQKNYERFAEVLRWVKDEVGPIFHVDWYGNREIGSEKNPEYVAFSRLVETYDIGDVISLNGRTDKVAELIPQFDVMCLPSIGEGFSNSISEYICCGKPVLCSDVADNGIMVKDGVNGFLFNPLDTQQMVDAFKRFFSLSEKEKEQMGIESRKIAESLFDKEKFVNSYIELIEK